MENKNIDSNLNDFIINTASIIKDLDHKIVELTNQNLALKDLIKSQTKLLIKYAQYYQDTVESFEPDKKFKQLNEILNKTEDLTCEDLKRLTLIYGDLDNDR